MGRVGLEFGGDVPREEFLGAVDWVFGDRCQDCAQIERGIKPIQLACSCRVSDYAEAEHAVLSWYRFTNRLRGIVLVSSPLHFSAEERT